MNKKKEIKKMNKQYYLSEIGFDTSIESELNLIQIAHGHCSKSLKPKVINFLDSILLN